MVCGFKALFKNTWDAFHKTTISTRIIDFEVGFMRHLKLSSRHCFMPLFIKSILTYQCFHKTSFKPCVLARELLLFPKTKTKNLAQLKQMSNKCATLCSAWTVDNYLLPQNICCHSVSLLVALHKNNWSKWELAFTNGRENSVYLLW